MAERSADWYAQAKRDLESARWQREGGFHEWACFLCQQAAEKALKAVYQRLGGEAWGHSVLRLLEGLAERATVSDAVLECARKLDLYYIPARYPNSWDAGSPQEYYTARDSEDALRCAEEILRFGEGLLAEPG